MSSKFILVSCCLLGGSGVVNAATVVGGSGFDGASGDTAYTLTQNGANFGGEVLAGGPTGNYFRITEQSNSNNNEIAFDTVGDTTGWTNSQFTVDFRADGGADGFSFALIPTATFGSTGGGAAIGEAEEPNGAGIFGIGFDVYNVIDQLSLHWDNTTLSPSGDISNTGGFDLNDNLWHSLLVNIDRDPLTGNALVDLDLFAEAGQGGAVTNVYTDFGVAGLNLEQFRVQFAGRTGGVNMNSDIDNLAFSITAPNIPEPATSGLIGLSGLLLLTRRMRR